MGRFTLRNGPFRITIRPISHHDSTHFATRFGLFCKSFIHIPLHGRAAPYLSSTPRLAYRVSHTAPPHGTSGVRTQKKHSDLTTTMLKH